MNFAKLDFLSSHPQLFIQNKTREKSKLGGFFSAVYFLVSALIVIHYIYNYFSREDYTIKYNRLLLSQI